MAFMGDEKKRVLVVDDEPNLLDMMVDFCDLVDVTPITAANGTEALAKAAQEKPDCILVDYRMPDMTGLDVIEKIKADDATKAIPIILLSADAKIHEVEAKKKGAFGILQKPMSRASLDEILKSCFGK